MCVVGSVQPLCVSWKVAWLRLMRSRNVACLDRPTCLGLSFQSLCEDGAVEQVKFFDNPDIMMLYLRIYAATNRAWPNDEKSS